MPGESNGGLNEEWKYMSGTHLSARLFDSHNPEQIRYKQLCYLKQIIFCIKKWKYASFFGFPNYSH